jgi:hypothetical protein
LGNILGLNSLENFYAITLEAIRLYGGATMLQYFYGNSLVKALEDVYPHHKWLGWKFDPNGISRYWDSKTNQKDFLDWLSNKLNFKNMEDWYSITVKQIAENGGRRLLQRYGDSRFKMIQSIYNTQQWNQSKFRNGKDWFKDWLAQYQ